MAAEADNIELRCADVDLDDDALDVLAELLVAAALSVQPGEKED